jgi:hypothetical protein
VEPDGLADARERPDPADDRHRVASFGSLAGHGFPPASCRAHEDVRRVPANLAAVDDHLACSAARLSPSDAVARMHA